jgi:hypothetical protein
MVEPFWLTNSIYGSIYVARNGGLVGNITERTSGEVH